MKTSSIGIALLVALSHAHATDLPREVQPTLLKPAAPFTPEGHVAERETRLRSKIEVHTVETGSKDGVHYSVYYSDGSGRFSGTPGNTLKPGERSESNWHVGCRKDAMDDTRSCHIVRGDLWVWAYSDGRRKVSIGGDTYPGTSARIRIDDAAPVTSPADSEGGFGPQGSGDAIRQMMTGQSVTTRYVDWPYRSNVDKTVPLHGFKLAYEYLEWALQNSR